MKTNDQVNSLSHTINELRRLVRDWENTLSTLDEEIIQGRKNRQGRNIKQIVGHMIDSACNNHQRIVRLQYTPRLMFPDYTPDNDLWINLQAYTEENWEDMVQLWKFYNLHIAHIMTYADKTKLHTEWTNGSAGPVSLKDIMMNYLAHFMLHIGEIERILKHFEITENTGA